mgnify:FL=1
MSIQQWYKDYKINHVNITPHLWQMHTIMDLAEMAIDSRYLNPVSNELTKNHTIYRSWNDYYKNLTFKDGKRRIVVSLSGGVDSMSLLYTIKNWKDNTRNDIDIVALHINFNNRKESYLESLYLQNWCKQLGIKLYVYEIKDYKRVDQDREEYEKTTRDLRFTLYKEMMTSYEGGVVLGHIKEDVEENFLRNILTHVNLFNILGMKNLSNISSVNIMRPFLGVSKDDIYDFAKKFSVPYFKDTTPDWSIRGRFRRRLKPEMEDIFGKKIGESFIEMGEMLQDLGKWFRTHYVKAYLHLILYYDNCIEFPYENEMPDIFWNIVIEDIFHNLKQSKPSHKTIKIMIKIIQDKKERSIEIKKGVTGEFKNGRFFIRY